jgi:hypothetical protein
LHTLVSEMISRYLSKTRRTISDMGGFGSDRKSSPGGGGAFKSRPSGIKKHSGGDKGRGHALHAPTGKFGFSRLQNDDSGDAGAAAHEGSGARAEHTGSRVKNKSKGKSQAAPVSARSALKNVAVAHLVASGAKKSKLLQKVYDSDAFTGKLNPLLNIAHDMVQSRADSPQQASLPWMQRSGLSFSGSQPPACATAQPVPSLPPHQTCSGVLAPQHVVPCMQLPPHAMRASF